MDTDISSVSTSESASEDDAGAHAGAQTITLPEPVWEYIGQQGSGGWKIKNTRTFNPVASKKGWVMCIRCGAHEWPPNMSPHLVKCVQDLL